MELVLAVLSWACILAGVGFLIVSGIGIVRMPDVFTRMHAAGIADTLGAYLVLLGLFFQAGLTINAAKLVLIGVFLFLTSPVATHAVARAALQGGVKPLLGPDREDG